MRRCKRLGVPLKLDSPPSPLKLRRLNGRVDVAESGMVVSADWLPDPGLSPFEGVSKSLPVPQRPDQSCCAVSRTCIAFRINSTD